MRVVIKGIPIINTYVPNGFRAELSAIRVQAEMV